MLLKGIKVLDLSNLLPGPMCSLLLADLGADVVKVESLDGDPMRRLGSVQSKSPYFSALNRNKRAISLNLKTSQGRKIFSQLAKTSDVIIESFRPGKADKLGAGYKSIKKINKKIVYCSITGYGQEGAYRSKAGHDLNFSALSGLLDLLSPKPFVPGVQIADICSAYLAAFLIVASLIHRGKTGKGNYIDVSMFGSALYSIGMHISLQSASGKLNSLLSGGKPCYNIYKTKDGRYISLAAVEKKFWHAFCKCTKRSDLLQKQFDAGTDTFKKIRDLFKSRTASEWELLNEEHDFCCEPIRKIEEVAKDNHLNDSKCLIDLEGIRQALMPATFLYFRKPTYSKSPILGEHTDKILSGIGYSKKSILKLRNNGVII